MNKEEVIKKYFGYYAVTEDQEQIIDNILDGHDVLAITPSDEKRKVCYQVPALMLPGITIIFTTVKSLMADHVKALNDAEVHAGYINSTLSDNQLAKVYDISLKGGFKILYVDPYYLNKKWFIEFAGKADLSMIVIDDAHFISHMNETFNNNYTKIIDLFDSLPPKPTVVAFTDTANEEIRNDIVSSLKIRDCNVVVTGFDRENIFYDVEIVKNKKKYIVDYVKNHLQESGIIFCAQKKKYTLFMNCLVGTALMFQNIIKEIRLLRMILITGNVRL